MADGGSGEPPAAKKLRVDRGEAAVDASVDNSHPPALPVIKIENIKTEVVDDCSPELDEGVTTEETNDGIDAKSKLPFVMAQGRYVCSACKETFMSEDALYGHVYRKCGNLLEMQCTLCSFQTEFVDDMRSHMAMKHGDLPDPRYSVYESLPTCGRCGESYCTVITEHLKECQGIRKYKCEFCIYETKWMEQLTKHVGQVHPVTATGGTSKITSNSPKIMMKCEFCKFETNQKNSLRIHMGLQHPIQELDSTSTIIYKCELCEYQTNRSRNLRLHMRSVHTVKKLDPQICPYCGNCYKDLKSLKYHKRYCKKSDVEILKHKCEFCDFQTVRRSSLKKHNDSLHPADGTGRRLCHNCGKSYKSNDTLKMHMKYCGKKDTEIMKHNCNICSYGAKRMSSLRKHMETQHPVEETGRPTCPDCGKSLKNDHTLKNHRRLCGKTLDELVKYICFHCSHETKRKSNLYKHIIRLHPVETIDRPICTGCGKSFKNDHSLGTHRRLCGKPISQLVKYVCFYCSHETKRKSNLNNHIIGRHPVEIKDRPICPGCRKSFKNDFSLQKHKRFCKKI